MRIALCGFARFVFMRAAPEVYFHLRPGLIRPALFMYAKMLRVFIISFRVLGDGSVEWYIGAVVATTVNHRGNLMTAEFLTVIFVRSILFSFSNLSSLSIYLELEAQGKLRGIITSLTPYLASVMPLSLLFLCADRAAYISSSHKQLAIFHIKQLKA